MHRSIFTDDHEAFRSSVRPFVERDVLPDADLSQSNGDASETVAHRRRAGIPRTGVPPRARRFAGRDYRFNVVLVEELAKVNMALASSLSIHFDVVRPISWTWPTAARQRWLPGSHPARR